jgi:hypothetical protein
LQEHDVAVILDSVKADNNFVVIYVEHDVWSWWCCGVCTYRASTSVFESTKSQRKLKIKQEQSKYTTKQRPSTDYMIRPRNKVSMFDELKGWSSCYGHDCLVRLC